MRRHLLAQRASAGHWPVSWLCTLTLARGYRFIMADECALTPACAPCLRLPRIQVYKALRHGVQPVAVKIIPVSKPCLPASGWADGAERKSAAACTACNVTVKIVPVRSGAPRGCRCLHCCSWLPLRWVLVNEWPLLALMWCGHSHWLL